MKLQAEAKLEVKNCVAGHAKAAIVSTLPLHPLRITTTALERGGTSKGEEGKGRRRRT
jgi:hypothetical protein